MRSSFACRLRLDVGELKDHQDRNVDCVVEILLDATQKFNMPLTWFLGCLDRAMEQSARITSSALEKELFWQSLKERAITLNERQKKVMNKLLSGFAGKLTRDKWMNITKASSRTALRDIEELIATGIMEREEAGGRSTSYRLIIVAKRIAEPKQAGHQ